MQRKRREELAAILTELQSRHAALIALQKSAKAGSEQPQVDNSADAFYRGAGLMDGALLLRPVTMSPREEARRRADIPGLALSPLISYTHRCIMHATQPGFAEIEAHI